MNLKQNKLLVVTLMIVGTAFSVFSQGQQLSVGKNMVARVNKSVITKVDVEKATKDLNKFSSVTGKVFTEKEVIESLIDQELLKEAVRTSKLVMDQNAFNNELNGMKQQYFMIQKRDNPAFEYSEEAFKKFVSAEGSMTYELFEEKVKEKVLIQQFVFKRAEAKLRALETKQFPDSELRTFRQENIDKFVMPESLELKQIFFRTVLNDGSQYPANEKEIVRKKAEDVLKRLKSGGNFDELCLLNTDDPQTRDMVNPKTNKVDRGYVGFVPLSGQGLQAAKQVFGDKTVDALQKYSKGNFSDVLESPQGYHVFLILDKPEERIISFNEAKDQIIDALKKQEREQLLGDEYEGLIKELRQKASISYF